MNYKRKYKEALERAKKMLASKRSVIVEKQALETIFPELAESEDELMRKEAISIIRQYNIIFEREGDKCYTADRVIAWLEKQDRQMIAKGERKNIALSIINYLDNNRVAGCMDLSNMECEDIEDACVNSKWTKLYNYMKKKLETPDVSDYNPYEATVKSIIAMTERYANGNDLRDFYDNVRVKCKDAINYDKTWIEKSNEQKITNKVVPKFKVGDWVIAKDNGVTEWLITAIGSNYQDYNYQDYSMVSSRGTIECVDHSYIDNHYRLWNIEDARDGDVLAIRNEYFLFKKKKDNTPTVYISHCFCDSAGAFRVTNGRDCGEFLSMENEIKVCPATNEQREFLFKKIKEAGYEWDSQNNSLSKI